MQLPKTSLWSSVVVGALAKSHQTGSRKVWSSDGVNAKGWKPPKRLPGHESDVIDLAWAPEDRFLASTGLYS
ncbi:hypothetical protein ACEPAG_5794 [Sanghuangporus baumii]